MSQRLLPLNPQKPKTLKTLNLMERRSAASDLGLREGFGSGAKGIWSQVPCVIPC